MPGVDLKDFADRLMTVNAPDQGMNYHGGHSGELRYNERTGERYWTRGEPATLTVYGDRARFLYDLIQNGEALAAAIQALDALSPKGGNSDD